MQNVNLHLAYLLTKHECVIIPGFGAFVVSSVATDKINKWGILYPPAKFLGFNPKLQHNDGLLANSIAKEKNISYNEAVHLIRRYVDSLHSQLNERNIINIPYLGDLCLSDENKIVFNPANNLSCNAFNYGFTNFHLPLLSELQNLSKLQESKKQENHLPNLPKRKGEIIWVPLNRRILVRTGSVAAALLAFFLIPTPLNNHSDYIPTQSASVFTFPASSKTIEADSLETDSTMITEALPATETTIDKEIKTENVAGKKSHQYFIIIASLPDKKSAEKTLLEFQSKGFNNADIISADGKHRIYINQFEDKKEAESFLSNFRKDNPKYSKTWLLGQNV
ncbi:cell division protein [Bacteroidia bacterium]|nr:cell division protein [Bacteroidia bacterium]GHT27320.1 cell division protein [Bacteroidia bacterium]GHV71518.1 cell division protein [Bacteroidia bacterium]